MIRGRGSVFRHLVILFSGFAIVLFFYQSIRNHNYENGNDLTSYLNSARWFFSGENPFTAPVRRYIYPLFLVIVSYPLSFLQANYWQRALAAATWSLVAYIAFFWTIFASWNIIYGARPVWGWLKGNLFPPALMILLLHPFLQDEFLNGQVNLFLVGSLAGYFFMLQRDRQFSAGLFLAIAAALKVAPALCLIFVIFTRQYRVIPYFIILFFLFVIGIPYAINDQSIAYYGYFVSEVLPSITTSDFEHGYGQYSILSTVSYAFNIHWNPLVKIGAICIVAAALLAPVIAVGWKSYCHAGNYFRLALFAAIMPVIPLTFPMSEAHHLLILTMPLVVIIAYWQRLVEKGKAIFKDRLLLLFASSMVLLHLGHAIKPAPLRLMGLLGLYLGMVHLLRSLSRSVATEPAQRGFR